MWLADGPWVRRGARRAAQRCVLHGGVQGGGVRPLADFKREVAELARYLKDTPPAEGSTGVLYPGEIEHLRAVECRQHGIEVEDATWRTLQMLAQEYGLTAELGFAVR